MGDPMPVRGAHRLPELKQALMEVGYTLDRAARLYGSGPSADELLSRTASVSLWHADPLEAGSSVLEALVTVLWLQGIVDAEAFDACVPSELRELLTTSGLIRRLPSGHVAASVSLIEYEGAHLLADRLFINDFDEGLRILDPPDVAMPLHTSSLELLDIAKRAPAGSSLLELGCGCGGTAIVLSAVHDVCLGLDLSPRAVAFAAANAALNSAPVEFVVGDALHDPTPARTWDLVLFNTPSEPRYDDVAATLSFGDVELRTLLGTTIPALLAPGGAAVVHILVPVTDDRGPVGWFEDRVPAPLDTFVQAVEDSPFTLTAEDVAAGNVHPGHYALRRPEDAPHLLAWLRQSSIRELVTCVATIRAPDGGG
jgi:SAM-dependent methyltransferase